MSTRESASPPRDGKISPGRLCYGDYTASRNEQGADPGNYEMLFTTMSSDSQPG